MPTQGSVLSKVMSPFVFVGEFCILLWEGLRRCFTRPFEVAEVFSQMAFIGVNSVFLVALTVFFSGAVLALYLAPLLNQFGGGPLAGATVGLTVTREIAPVVTGIMVASRCGSAIAAQIGSMAVTEQLDALRAMSVHPYNYLLVPRLIAGIVMLPMLCLIACYAGIGGGVIVSNMNGIHTSLFMASLQDYIHISDFTGAFVKAMAFGVIIVIVACLEGLKTRGGAVGVGRVTTRTVVISMVLIYISNYFLAAVLF